MDLLCSMANSPLYLSAVRSSALAVVCARITGGPFNQVSLAIICRPHAFSGYLGAFLHATATASCTLKLSKHVYIRVCMSYVNVYSCSWLILARMQANESKSLTHAGLAISLLAPAAMHFMMASQREWCLAMHMLSMSDACMQAAAESHRAQQLIELVEELRHKLAQAGA